MTQSPPMWRFSGNQLKRWRTKANVSREQLAAASNYSPDTIKAMEQGVRMPTPRVLDVADELCRAEGLLSAAKDYLSREKFPPRAQEFMEREREAIGRWSYDATYIPGLLQTKGYTRTLIENRYPPLDEETVEQRITGRMERQAILTERKPPVALSFVIYEAALHSPWLTSDNCAVCLRSPSCGMSLCRYSPSREPFRRHYWVPWCCWRRVTTSGSPTLKVSWGVNCRPIQTS